MFTARSFLEAPPGLEKRLGLPKELSAHPERLRREFLEIAINSSEHFLLRQGALSTIWLHADEMNARSSREFVDALLGAFVREFTPAKLESICSLTREIEHNGEAHGAGFLAYLFCAALTKVAPEASKEQVRAVHEALKGTMFEELLDEHLENVRRKKESGG